MEGISLPCDAKGFSIERFQNTEKLRIMSSGMVGTAI